ncbi:MAG: ABC transporter permease [Chitinophagaceae bacterium]|nr:ABC transporter permease [Chitinophagaceae bacterium]
MFKSYFKTAWRNLLRNKVYSIINILGLAIGMTACFFIFQYVVFESGYDRFNTNAANIYRVPISFSGSLSDAPPSVMNYNAVARALKRDFPEVVDAVRLLSFKSFSKSNYLSYQEEGGQKKAFFENDIYFADSSFFRVFSYPLVRGDKAHCLSDWNAIVISESMAKKYFGNQDPIGKILVSYTFPSKVTGVFADLPENSHLKFDALVPLQPALKEWKSEDNWGWPAVYTYVLLKPGTDAKKLEAKFPAFIDKYLGKEMKEMNFRPYFHLQPLTDIHLTSHYIDEAEVNGDEKEVFFLSVIGVFILLIAWINYINLSTAKSMERAKEVGIRKVSGAAKKQLIIQFLIESLMTNLLALVITIIIITQTMPLFNQLVGRNISAAFFTSGMGSQPSFWFWSAVIFLSGSLLVGAYPAFILSSFNPVRVLKGLIIKSNTKLSLRRALLSFQFFLSIILIAATLVVFAQLNFMRKGDLGYNKNQLLVVKMSSAFTDSTHAAKLNYFKQEVLRQFSSVKNISYTGEVPGRPIKDHQNIRKVGEDKQHSYPTFVTQIDHDFINTYQVPLVAGSNLSPADSSEVLSRNAQGTFGTNKALKVLVNEELVKSLGFKSVKEALNQRIIFLGGNGEYYASIKGVVKNFHQRSLKDAYEPILFIYPSYNNWGWDNVSLNINTGAGDLDKSLSGIESLFKKTFPGKPFEFFFLDDFFNNQYLSDQRLGNVFGLFASLAIVVACLGLLGLSAFVIKLRTKEIGIRKVLGASVSSVLLLVSKDFIKLVCLAAVIAVPITYWAANEWLNNYAFHIRLSWLMFMLPPLILLLIVLLTVCLQSLKAAAANPVKSLRTE